MESLYYRAMKHTQIQKRPDMERSVKKRKRHIRKSLIVLFVSTVCITVFACFLPSWIASSRLKKLGYDKNTISRIQEQDLANTILSHSYYSDYLAQVINDGTIEKDYMYLYTLVSPERDFTASDFLLYNRLLDKGYETDQLIKLFQNLNFYELTPLLVFDYQWNEQLYIDDCLNCRDKNSPDAFQLEGSYITRYRITEEVKDPNSSQVLVNCSNILSKEYVPSDLVDISTEHSVANSKLRQEAADAFTKLSTDSVDAKHSMFASTTYVDYASQESAYSYYRSHFGDAHVDAYSARPGSSEHQTGLAVNVSLTYENTDDFANTEAYKWLKENETSYGFIERYPPAKASITGYDEITHLRYVGPALAKAITDSHLTYDEYYELYLAPWQNDANKPSKEILKKADPLK